MKKYYYVFWTSVVSGTWLGIFAGIYSLITQNKYLTNHLYNLAFLQFLKSFNGVAISLIILGIFISFLLRYEQQIKSKIQRYGKLHIVIVGTAAIVCLGMLRMMGIDIPIMEVQKSALLFRIPFGLMLILFCLVVYVIILRSTRGMKWPQQRPIFLLSFFVLFGIHLGVFSRALISKKSASQEPNILIISIDTIRAHHLGCYGYYRDTSPNIDRFAAESIRFDKVVVPMATTLPSYSSLFTGVDPVSHGVKMNGMKLSSKNLTLTEILKDKGYSTAAMVGSVVLKKDMGLSQGFDVYDDEMKGDLVRPAGAVRQSAENWIKQNQNSTYFMLLHFYDTHDPYSPPAPFDTLFHSSPQKLENIYLPTKLDHLHLRKNYPDYDDQNLPALIQKEIDLYDGEIKYVDQEIGKFFDFLKSNGLWNETLVIVTGDHGESLGERGLWGHSSLYEEQILAPLLVKLPGEGTTSLTIRETVRLIDIMPTILDLLNIRYPNKLDGRSLLEFINHGNNSVSRTAYVERRDYPDHMKIKYPDENGRGKEYALRTDEWKLILKELEDNELYNLKADPFETNNLIAAKPEIAKSLEDSIYTWLAGNSLIEKRTEINVDAETLKQLKSLGYIR